MLNNQKGFSLFSIIAAIVVMGFLATVAITKMSDSTAVLKRQSAALAACRSLNSLEDLAFPAFVLSGADWTSDTGFFNYLKSNHPGYFGIAPTELGDYYTWTEETSPSATGGTLTFTDTGGNEFPVTIDRIAGDRSPGRWKPVL